MQTLEFRSRYTRRGLRRDPHVVTGQQVWSEPKHRREHYSESKVIDYTEHELRRFGLAHAYCTWCDFLPVCLKNAKRIDETW